MMQQIVVSGGAGYWSGPDGIRLDEFVLALTGKHRPRVCAISTASGDHEEYMGAFDEMLGPRCEPSHLRLFRPPFSDPERLLLNQDLIYVGGGSTANMLAVWRLHGIDRLLRKALQKGTILYGSSAGGICWFESGISDSLSFDGVPRPLDNGLRFIPGSHAPHFDAEGRPAAYAAMVGAGDLADGLGIDEFAAVHFVNGSLTQVVSVRPPATAHKVSRQAGGITTVTALPFTPLT